MERDFSVFRISLLVSAHLLILASCRFMLLLIKSMLSSEYDKNVSSSKRLT